MDINKDLKKIALCIMVLAFGSAMIGAVLGIFAYSQHYVPPIEPQWLSRLTRLKIDSNADVLVLEAEGHTTQTTNLIEAQQSDSAVVFSVSNDGNVLISGTLTISDAIAFAGDLDMGNNIIENIGAAGTDFLAGGSLQTAQIITVSSGGINITGVSTFNDNVDMANNEITNIGAAGTDFQDDGGLVTASTITVTTGGLVISDGGMSVGDGNVTNVGDIALDTISADDGSSFTISNDWTNAGNTVADLGAVTTADVNGGTIDGATIGGSSAAAGSFTTLVVTSTLNVQGATDFDSTLDMSNQAISNIGAAGTDFTGVGGLTLADALTISSGGANVTGDIDGSAEFQVGTWLNIDAQTSITVTNSATFTPTGTYQLIIAASEVTPTISTTGFTAGDQLELHNTGAPVINFEATGTQKLKDDYPMDQYDVLGLRFDGTNWIELYRTGPRI